MSLVKDKEFFQYVEKTKWQKAVAELKGPQALRTLDISKLSTFNNLTPAAEWAASSLSSAWSLKITDNQYWDRPTEIAFYEPKGNGQLSSGLLELSVDDNKKAKIYLNFAGAQPTESILALRVEVHLGSKSELEIFIVQNQSLQNSHVFHLDAELEEKAHLKIYHVNGGSKWSESSYHFSQNGEESVSDLKVLQLGHDQQKHRIWATSNLNKSYTKTSQLVKTLLNDESKNHFIGRICIAEGITEVDAFQRNQNLLLSRKAQALNQPELEVLSDNVKAAHGSATGFMNQDELFYLQSRGLTEFEGRKFLAEAFAFSLFSDLDSNMKNKAQNILKERIADVCT